MVAGIFLVLILILVIIKLIIQQKSKKKLNQLSEEVTLNSKQKSGKRKLEVQNNPYKYEYWNKIINGSKTVEIDKPDVSSQIILDNWDYISKYYYVIKEEVRAMRNDTNFKEEQIVYDLSFNKYLTKELYKRNLELTENIITDFLTNILNNSQKLRNPETNVSLKVISLIYFLCDNSSFYLCAEPSRLFHNEKYSEYLPEFELKHEFNINIHEIEYAIFNDLSILVGDYYDDYAEYTYNSFSEIMFKCWETAKQRTNSKLLGSLDYGTGGVDYDLDTGESINDFDIVEHYKNRGITIEKYLDN
ncbi:hypothetical protein [Tenacibaculum ovolyticum]|uniref:hypothetical protein n=1 Tax=Tenacibaculum ovolyticum TaxID=104270 RepID=UPI003BAC9492